MTSTPDEIIFTGHGLPARVPFHVTPAMRHSIEFEFVDDVDAPVDQDGTAWTATMHDAITGELVATYLETIVDNVITFALAAATTTTLDPLAAYEIRIVRDNPGPDMIFAGPVLFTDETIPVAA